MARPRKHGYAALAPQDVPDAKAGTSGVDLRAYAAERGLEVITGSTPAGYRAAVPAWPEYLENVMRGVLPGGEYGLLYHEKLELPTTGGMSGTLYAKVTGKASWKDAFRFNRTDLPFIGDFLDPPTDHSPPEPYDNDSAWVPCTVAALHVPETAAVLGQLRLDRRHHHGQYDFAQHRTLPGGWHLRTGADADEAAVARVLGGPLPGVLAGIDAALLQVVVLHGTLILRRNGYLKEPAALDAHASLAAFAAGELRAACLPATRPQAFAEPLPRWDAQAAELPPPWVAAFAALATRLDATLEDPRALHLAFPSLPVPGTAVAVLRLGSGERLVYTEERLVRRAQQVRGALLAAAAPGAATPPGGARDDELVVAEVRDGVLACWSRRTADITLGEADELLSRSRAAAGRLGLAAAP
ncbi:MAG TPA: hypothetical protein VD836_08580 [Solirubrobacteraceae bacterium]|nr:hypothetical protein [Solirubrobacteraceae bacterium]